MYGDLLGTEPNLLTNYVPHNSAEQKRYFLAGDNHIPDHHYDKLDSFNFVGAQARISLIGQRIITHPDLNPKYAVSYQGFIDDYRQKTRLMELAHDYKDSVASREKAKIRQDYMKLNIQLYGEPYEDTYRSLLQDKLNQIDRKRLSQSASQLRDELFGLVDYVPTKQRYERFTPSKATVKWMHLVAKNLYGDMLSHAPDQAKFSVAEVRDIFAEILEQEFGEAAAGWTVDIEPAKSINVKSAQRQIVLPERRVDMTYRKLQDLIVHEIGVHFLRSVMGAETDLLPLQNGLNRYYAFEEGLGMVMQQALKGKFSESGVEAYITAGLAYYDHKDFRDTFEVKWRLSALRSVKRSVEITENAIAKAKNRAYSRVMRSMRGTDELPWFKDLAYYNGSIDVWRHLESIKGDDIKLMSILTGKIDPTNIEHLRVLMDIKAVG